MAESERRSSINRMSGDQAGGDGAGDGVGGRHGSGRRAVDGGGYLDICTTEGSLSGEALTVRELRQMGLPRLWIDAADLLGAGRLIELWRHLDRNAHVEHEGRLRVTMPRFSHYRRFQRNRFIQALAVEGLCSRDIQETVYRELGERISLRHIERLMKG